jgi:hypothetical protein
MIKFTAMVAKALPKIIKKNRFFKIGLSHTEKISENPGGYSKNSFIHSAGSKAKNPPSGGGTSGRLGLVTPAKMTADPTGKQLKNAVLQSFGLKTARLAG